MVYLVLGIIIALLIAAVVFFAASAGDKNLRQKIRVKTRENDDLNIEIKDIRGERVKVEKEIEKLEKKEVVFNDRAKSINVPGDSVSELLDFLEKQ